MDKELIEKYHVQLWDLGKRDMPKERLDKLMETYMYPLLRSIEKTSVGCTYTFSKIMSKTFDDLANQSLAEYIKEKEEKDVSTL